MDNKIENIIYGAKNDYLFRKENETSEKKIVKNINKNEILKILDDEMKKRYICHPTDPKNDKNIILNLYSYQCDPSVFNSKRFDKLLNNKLNMKMKKYYFESNCHHYFKSIQLHLKEKK